MGEALNVENESTESNPSATAGDGDIWLPGDNETRPARMPTPINSLAPNGFVYWRLPSR